MRIETKNNLNHQYNLIIETIIIKTTSQKKEANNNQSISLSHTKNNILLCVICNNEKRECNIP